jgi:hypothetical protein
MLQKNTGRITEVDFVRFLLKGAIIAPNRSPASKMVSFITKKHWTDYEGQFRDVLCRKCPEKESNL